MKGTNDMNWSEDMHYLKPKMLINSTVTECVFIFRINSVVHTVCSL